jgi:hypothetical protein
MNHFKWRGKRFGYMMERFEIPLPPIRIDLSNLRRITNRDNETDQKNCGDALHGKINFLLS